MKTVRLLAWDKSNNRNSFQPEIDYLVPDTMTVGRMLMLASASGYDSILVAGGEPALRRDLPRIVATAASLGLQVALSTNARIFSCAGAAAGFAAAGLKRAVVCLAGADPAVHDAAVGTESFAQTVAGIEALVECGIAVDIDVPVCSFNVGGLSGIGRLAARLGARSVCFRLPPVATSGGIERIPDLKAACDAVTSAVLDMDDGFPEVTSGYCDLPCCLLPALKGRELQGARTADTIIVNADGIPELIPSPDPSRAMPVPCAACELRRSCPTIEPDLVRERGAGDLHLPLQSVSDAVFTRVRRMVEPLIVDGRCPWRDGPIQSVLPVDYLHLVTPAGWELWTLSAGHWDSSTLMHAKNIRNNLVMNSSGRIPSLDGLCANCENLARCAGVFHVGPDSPVAAMPSASISSAKAGTADFLRWPDFASGFSDFVRSSAGSPVSINGTAPVIRLLDEPSGPASSFLPQVEPLMLWEAARKATMCGLTDYDLPYVQPAFRLEIQASDRWAEVDRMGTILIIRKCTMNCIICQVQKFYEGIDIMPLPDVVKFLEEFRLLGYTRLDLFGGEPTMRRDLVDLVAFAHRMGFYTDLITNGTLMDDALATALRDAGLDLCIVSLDGPTPEIHDKIRRVKDGHQRAVSGIEAVVRAGGMEVNVDTVVLPDNIDYLIDLARQVSALGVTRINMFLCLEGPISSPVPRLLGFERTLDFYERIVPEMRRIGEPCGTSISVGPRLPMAGRSIRDVAATRMFADVCEGTYNVVFRHPEILCKAPDDEVYISLFGDVFPCTAPQMLESSARMGNVYRQKLIEVVRSEKWNEFKKISGHHEGCRMCWRAHFDLDREGEERILDSN